ncbi:MAG: aldo/keto reductase [Pseudomonadota bacterium]|nr:aldo/keto reductase [Pseudomonadota bacterium]
MTDGEQVISAYGVAIPRILYGTAWKKMQTEDLVKKAIRAGFRGIDTACQPKHYHEAGVGAGVAACLGNDLGRGNLYLQSKFTPLSGHDPTNVPYDPKADAAAQVQQSFAQSLRNLRTDYVDCLVLHSPLQSPHMMPVWRAMERIFDSGNVKQLGISNCYSLEYLEALCDSVRIKPAVLQNRFYAESNYDRNLRIFCRRSGIIYQSFWTLTANPQVLADDLLQALAANYRRTTVQILFRYLSQNDIIPLTGTKSEVHMREDLSIFDFTLTQDECAAMNALFESGRTG